MSLLWEQCLAAFLQEKYARSQSEATVAAYRSMLNLFFIRLHKSPELATHEDVVSFMLMPTCGRTQHGTPPSASTKNQRLQAVHLFYAFAARYKVIDGYGKPYKLFTGDNPAEGLRHSKVLRHPKALTDQEVTRLFSVIPRDTVAGKRDLALFTMYLYSARRRSEVLGLKFGDISWESVTDENGVSRQAWIYRYAFKGSGGQMTTAELPLLAKLAIDDYLAASGRMPLAPDDYIFVGSVSPRGCPPLDPYKPLTGRAVTHRLKLYAELAGLDPRRFHVHAWRHTSSVLHYQAEHDVLKLMRLLGHMSLNTTQIYLQSLLVATSDDGAWLITERFGHLFGL